MKKSKLYLLSLAAGLLLASCSHTAKMTRTETGSLQYAQTAPQTEHLNTAPEAATLPKAVQPDVQVVTAPEKMDVPRLNPKQPSSLKEKLTVTAVKKQFREKYAETSQKISQNKLLKQATASDKDLQLERKIKIAIILIVVGLILGSFGWKYSLFWLIGTIMVAIGLIILLFWLLDEL
jgi:hypothetical protein